MDTPIITTSSVRKNDMFAIVGFVSGMASIPYCFPMRRLFSDLWGFRDYYNNNNDLSTIILALVFASLPLFSVSSAIIGIIRIRLNMQRKGLGFALTGLISALVVLIYSIWWDM